jgi:acid phosphatase type 7
LAWDGFDEIFPSRLAAKAAECGQFQEGFLMKMCIWRGLMAGALCSAAIPAFAAPAVIDLRGEPAPPAPGAPYAARNLPDRIVLTPGEDPATTMLISYRTDAAADSTVAELAELVPAPNFGIKATAITGTSAATDSENGPALYHKISFAGLQPDTAYAYRIKGSAGFSEWHQFRTAKQSGAPFSLIFMGDTQNSILDIGSLVWRRALLQAANPALMLHAGDLVASRDEMVHDDEWGEWTAAGGWAQAAIPQIPAPGNHEYVDDILPDGSESRRLGAHWPVMFNLPQNGAQGAEATTYFTDYQGVRVVVLDGTSAIDLGTLDAQTAWLDRVLGEAPGPWKIVLFHQPIFTCARAEDTPKLKQAWKPVFEQHQVDLVLQGHDHCYGRWTAAEGAQSAREARAGGADQGPVYLVSVAGAKMYGLNDRFGWQPDRVAEDTSLFQIIDIAPDRLTLKAFLNSGVLYDGFELIKQDGRGNRFAELPDDVPTVRRCDALPAGPVQTNADDLVEGRKGPDGLPCTARVK